jgi:glycosyltransferase involved in cell wall biosynthesis
VARESNVDPRPLRIARVIARLNVGGPAIHVSLLTGRLPRDRFESRLYVGSVSPGEIEMTDAFEREAITPIRIPHLGRSIGPFHDSAALWHLVRAFRQFRPDIVHTHTAKAGTLGRVAAKIARVPITVHTFHGHTFDGYFSPLVTRGFLAIERTLARGTDAIVTISPRQFADITEKYRVAPPEKTRIIPLGFDLSRFDDVDRLRGDLRRDLGVGDHPVISVIGRLVPIKDHALLFQAFARLKTPDAHLVVVGGGELLADLKALASSLAIADRVHFLGFRMDIDRILADTDVVALTSKNEGTPVAVIEALAAGCAAVATDVGGVADVLEGGTYGRLVADRSPDAFAAAIDDALADRERAGSRRSAAQAYAREHYGADRLITDHVALYDGLAERLGLA